VNVSALRTWLCDLLRFHLVDTEVGVFDLFPGDALIQPEMMFFTGAVSATAGVQAFRAGSEPYEHDLVLPFVIEVRADTEPAVAEARAFELVGVLRGVLATNAVPPGGLAYWAVLGDQVDSSTGWLDSGAMSQVRCSVRFHIDAT
jgi:hypothetical protein